MSSSAWFGPTVGCQPGSATLVLVRRDLRLRLVEQHAIRDGTLYPRYQRIG
jgi:hypothetical protein